MSHNPEFVMRRLQARANAMRHQETLRAADKVQEAPRRRPETNRHVEFLIVRNHHPIHLVATDAAVSALIIHRIDGRSEVCTDGVRYCWGCDAKAKSRWAGYLGAVIVATRKPVILCLTPHANKSLQPLGALPGGLFRRSITVARAFNSVRAKLWATLGEQDAHVMLPYLPSVSVVLQRRYNIDPLELEVLHKGACAYPIDNGDDEGENDGPC